MSTVLDGEKFGRALRWIGEQRRLDPTLGLMRLIEDAAIRFNLSPGQEQSLIELLRKPPSET